MERKSGTKAFSLMIFFNNFLGGRYEGKSHNS